MSNLIPYVVVWSVLALGVIVLYAYRRAVAKQEDETLHVLDAEVAQVSQQTVVARKLEVIDRWGKLVTLLAVLYTLALVGLYIYNAWMASSRVVME